MSVIFDQLDNPQPTKIAFTQAIKLGSYLYLLNNGNLKKIITQDCTFQESDAIQILQNVSQICTDGKIIFCLQSNGDLYQIDGQPKLLVQNKNYISITPLTAIDHSGRGFYWKNQKSIYSHCKHISVFKDKMTLITIGGKIFNIEKDQQVSIPQLNGLGVNSYFKKSLLFQFGGIAITENGDAYCYNSKMIKLKTNTLDDIVACSRFLIGISGKYIIQWNLEDFQNHQFYVNQSLFKKMNYGHEIQINSKKKEFQEIRSIFADPYTQFYCAQVKILSKINQHDQTITTNVLERTFCRSSVQNLKQQLFDCWDPPQKKKTETRMSRQLKNTAEKTDRSQATNRQTDRNEESTIKQSNFLDQIFEKSSSLNDPTSMFKDISKSKQEKTVPLEITKLSIEKNQELEKEPTKLLEQYQKQFNLQSKQNSEQTIDQSTDQFEQSKEQDSNSTQNLNQVENTIPINFINPVITQKLQSIRELYDQPRFKTQNNSLYTLDEESSVEQSLCQDEEEQPQQNKKYNILNLEINEVSKQQISSFKENLKFKQPDTFIEELNQPTVSKSLNNLINLIQVKPEFTLDSLIQKQSIKEEEQIALPILEQQNIVDVPKQIPKTIKSFLKNETKSIKKSIKQSDSLEQQSVIDYQENSEFIESDSFMQILTSEKKNDNSRVQNIMQIFDTISVQPQIPKLNLFKKNKQQDNQKQGNLIEDEQLDENLIAIPQQAKTIEPKNILTDKSNVFQISPNKITKEHKTLITFSEDIQCQSDDRVVIMDQNIKKEQIPLSPQKENIIKSDQQKPLIKVHNSSDVKQPFEQQKQALSRVMIQPVNCHSSRPEKNFTPLKSSRNGSVRQSSIDTSRFKGLQIDTQQLTYAAFDLDSSNAMYHVNQTSVEDTRRTPITQANETLNNKKQPNLTRVASTSQIPQSIRTNSMGPIKKDEISPIKALQSIKNAKPHEDLQAKSLRRRQDIVIRKLFFRLDVHIKLAKLEFMFNFKQKTTNI